MFGRSAATLTLLSLFLVLQTASAEVDRLPQDAVGNVRTSVAPYVQPADRLGRLTAADFSLRCMVSCPSESIEVVEFREGGSGITRKSPGRYHADDVTICADKKTLKPVLDWFRALKTGQLTSFRKNLVLELLGKGADGREVVTCRFNLSQTWPHQVNWSYDGTACLQLAVEGTEMVDP
jgi:tail tube protein gp19